MIRATVWSLSSRKDPVLVTSNPWPERWSTIPPVTSTLYGVTTPIRVASKAPNAATAAVMGLVFGASGWARRMAASTRASPISVAAEVQP